MLSSPRIDDLIATYLREKYSQYFVDHRRVDGSDERHLATVQVRMALDNFDGQPIISVMPFYYKQSKNGMIWFRAERRRIDAYWESFPLLPPTDPAYFTHIDTAVAQGIMNINPMDNRPKELRHSR